MSTAFSPSSRFQSVFTSSAACVGRVLQGCSGQHRRRQPRSHGTLGFKSWSGWCQCFAIPSHNNAMTVSLNINSTTRSCDVRAGKFPLWMRSTVRRALPHPLHLWCSNNVKSCDRPVASSATISASTDSLGTRGGKLLTWREVTQPEEKMTRRAK